MEIKNLQVDQPVADPKKSRNGSRQHFTSVLPTVVDIQLELREKEEETKAGDTRAGARYRQSS